MCNCYPYALAGRRKFFSPIKDKIREPIERVWIYASVCAPIRRSKNCSSWSGGIEIGLNKYG